jgi:Sulfatase-modifying factor enzyme 1
LREPVARWPFVLSGNGQPGYRGKGFYHDVGQKRSNAFGLYNMHGGVWEWCLDRYDKANLVLDLGKPGAWDDKGFGCFSLSRIGDQFMLWYLGARQEPKTVAHRSGHFSRWSAVEAFTRQLLVQSNSFGRSGYALPTV